MNTNNSRIHAVDALRGFAIVSIMLLHNLEHFDFYYLPPNLPTWMTIVDKGVWDSLFFLFAGKSYAIFALLFGLTYFIQSNNQKIKGKDFRLRFAWRLLLLLVFGLFNSAFYQGDILTIYAIIGFILIPVSNFNNKTVFWVAIFFMFQPYEWFNFFSALNNPGIKLANPISWSYFEKTGEYISNGSFFQTVYGNLTNGKVAVLNWTWENGRVFQTMSLFLLGMLAGRTSIFTFSEKTKRLWYKVLLFSGLSFISLYFLKNASGKLFYYESLRRPLLTIFSSWSNFAFMLIIVSCFLLLLFHSALFNKILRSFSSIGRMSLSNYIFQSILGSFIYYGFGLGLYKYTGATYSLLIGLLLAITQGYFSSWWMKNHHQGPLESVWHKLTWMGSKKK